MALTLPYMVYPANDSETYTFNSNDQINVSWYWKDPPLGASVNLLLYIANPGKSLALELNSSNYPASGYTLEQLQGYPAVKYPATGLFNISAVLANGTEINNPNAPNPAIITSSTFAVTNDNGQQASCRNCSFAAASSHSSIIHATSTSAPTSTATIVTTPTSTPDSSGSSGLSPGAIAGIVVGVVAALAMVGAFAWWFGRRGRDRTVRDSMGPQSTGAMSPDPPDEKHGSQYWEPIGIQMENNHAGRQSGQAS